MRRKGSQNRQCRLWLPADVREAARGRTFVLDVAGERVAKRIGPTTIELPLSLRTNDPSEAKRRQASLTEQFETFCVGLRQQAQRITLTHEECLRLAGDFFRAWTKGGPDAGWVAADGSGLRLDGELEAAWRAIADRLAEHDERGHDTVPSLRSMVEAHLLRRGFAVDAPTLDAVCTEALKAIKHAAATQATKAAGDYGKPDDSGSYGAPLPAPAQAAKGKLSFDKLIELWSTNSEKEPTPSTVASYAGAFTNLAKTIGHDDARRLTKAEVVRFIEERKQVVRRVTVRGTDLAGVRSVMAWAIENGHVGGPNPAEGIRVSIPKSEKKTKTRANRNDPDAGTGYTDAEAKVILRAALGHRKGANEKAKTAAAMKWIPWLLAYCGTRVGEMAQLRKQDVRQHESGFWYADLTPEAGTVKNDKQRYVPLHSHLIELGFAEFVKAAPDGHLFLDPRPADQSAARKRPKLKPGYEDRWDSKRKWKRTMRHSRTDDPRGILGPLRGLTNRLAQFTHEVLVVQGVDPNHGWRHRFKSWAMAGGGMSERMVDEIQGHGPKDANQKTSRGYGKFSVSQKRAAIEKLPRYEITTD